MPELIEIVRCKECEFQLKKWIIDLRMKEKGYFIYACELNDPYVESAVTGLDNEYCSSGIPKK